MMGFCKKMEQWLRAFSALAENPGSVPRITLGGSQLPITQNQGIQYPFLVSQIPVVSGRLLVHS